MEYNVIDLSEWQGVINWDKAKESNVDGVILRACFGWDNDSQIDKKFYENIKGAKKANIPIGAYHYSYALNAEDAIKEANFFTKVIKNIDFEYPVYIDIEDPSQFYLNNETLTDIAVAFCSQMEYNGYYVGIYSSSSIIKNRFIPSRIAPFDIWVAQWSKDKPNLGRDYGIWQYSSNGDGKAYGTTSSRVDMNTAYKNYPLIMNNRSGNPLKSNPITIPPPISPPRYKKGDSLTLNKKPLYSTATSLDSNPKNYLTGTYYIYDGININGRMRITNTPSRIGKAPLNLNVTGYINV